MSYQALYREWRPATFSEVSGQEHVKQTLSNMLKQQKVPHALLFCGPRGTGKTTMAKILARAVNCSQGVTAEPCLTCSACTGVRENSSLDVMEIDAASNRGIDEIRELREHVKYSPVELRYKVYIIDEVHMLTTEAFNALLKTLEEPPAYVLFILCTTEPHKLPATIISRCQRFDFKRLGLDSLTKRLQVVAKANEVDLTIEAAKLIAEQAQGGMRDALGMLEQCMAYSAGSIDVEIVQTVTGSVPTTVFRRLLGALCENNLAYALELLNTELMNGREAGQYLTSYISTLRVLMLAAHSPQVLQMQGYEPDQAAQLKELADKLVKALPELITLALTTDNDMRYGGHPRLHLELLLVKQYQAISEGQWPSVLAEPTVLKTKAAELAKAPKPATEKPITSEQVPTQAPAPSQQGVAISGLLKAWPEVVKAIKQRAPLTGATMGAVSPLRMEGNTIILQLVEHNMHTYKRLSNSTELGYIAAAFQTVLGRSVEVKLVLPTQEAPSVAPSTTDDSVKQVLDIFQGTIVKDKL